jgi:rhamnulokinase
MSKAASFAAIDLGAESGRVILGTVSDPSVRQRPGADGDELHWDVLRLWAEMKQGVARPHVQAGELQGIGIDTWGVDFGLLGGATRCWATPFTTATPAPTASSSKAFEIVPREEIFEQTGIQFMQFNTIFQLLAMKLGRSPLLDMAETCS